MTAHNFLWFRKVAITFLLGTMSFVVWGQDEEIDPVTRTYAIKNATIIQSPGRIINRGTVIIKNGLIRAVGQQIDIPPEARIIDADSMHVYAGFIDGLAHVGVPEPNKDSQGQKVKDPGNPPNSIAGIEPHRDVRSMLDANHTSIADLRKVGFTTAHVVPHGRMLPGQGAVILLAGNKADALVYKEEFSLFSQLKGAPGIYPNTVIGVMAKYRELYRQAIEAKAYLDRYEEEPAGLERPITNRVLEAFYPVIDKQIPVAFKAEEVLDIQRVLTLQEDLDFNLILAEIKQGWGITGQLKSSGAKLFLSLDLPEDEEEDSVSAEIPEIETMTEIDLEKKRLQARKDEMMKKYYSQPALFDSLGLSFGFSTMEAKSEDIKSKLIKFIENGLDEEAALAALTTTPARLLGLSSTMGTIDKGKIANLLITNKPYFQKEAAVRYVFVDGKIFEYEALPEEEEPEVQPVDVTGTWTYTTETPQGVGSGDIIIRGEPDDYAGTISSDLSGDINDLSDIVVDGNELSFSFEMVISGETLNANVVVTIEDDTFEGTMTLEQLGNFPITGERTPKK